MNNLKALDEFQVGKHGICYVDSDFKKHLKDQEFSPVSSLPTYKKLPRNMRDVEIESELKPGICTLGDVLYFLDNPPEETKDGVFNLFYFPQCVVGVYRVGDEWYVHSWDRGGGGWNAGSRVFSPAIDRALKSSESCCSHCTLNLRLSDLEDWKTKVEKVLKV